MPEIKNNFTGGKMNKDLDERLIPNGQYKDALNTLNNGGQSKSKVLDICSLLLSDKSDGLTGRLIAAQWDDISPKNIHHIINNKSLFTLKRIDNKYFNEKK